MIETWHHLDPAEKQEHQSPVKVQHCDLDHDIKRVSREDKLVVSEVDLQERKQDEDLMSPVLLLGSTQTSAPDVSVDSTGKGNEEQNGNFKNFTSIFFFFFYK